MCFLRNSTNMKILSLRRCVLAASLFCALLGAARGAVPDGWETVDVLDHRLTLALPKGAKPFLEREVPPNRPGEQRLTQGFVVLVGSIPVEVIVTEMVARTDEDIESVGWGYVYRQVPAKDGKPVPSVVATKPNGVDVVTFALSTAAKVRGTFVLKSAILRRPDNMLMRLDFHVEDFKGLDSAEVSRAVDAVIASVRIGARQLPAGKGVTLAEGDLTMDLLPGYVAVEEPRTEGVVVNVLPIRKPGEARGVLKIHVASRHDCHPDKPVGTLSLFGRKGEWYITAYADDWQGKDVCLLAPADARQIKIQVRSPDKQTEQDLLTILDSVRSKTLR